VSSSDDWRNVSRNDPCPLCGGKDWCSASSDGDAVVCGRAPELPPGWRQASTAADGRGVYVRGGERARAPRPAPPKPTGQAPRDWAALEERSRKSLTNGQLDSLARELGVGSNALRTVGLGWLSAELLRDVGAGGGDGWTCDAGAYSVAERDGRGRVVGLALRAPGGAKGYPSGARRGLVVPANIDDLGGPVLAVEGASDVTACVSLCLAAVGRPSNVGGADALAERLRQREVLVVGERDERNGRWPGRDGAIRVARRLARVLRRPVAWTLPPTPAKDVRAWLCLRAATGLDLGDEAACRAAGAELLKTLYVSAETVEPPITVRLAPDKYGRKLGTLAVGEEGEDLAGDDVLYVGRLRIAEPEDRANWICEAAAAALKLHPWLGAADSARERVSAALDAAVRAAAAEEASDPDDENTPTVAEAVVRLALERYRFGVSQDGEPFAVEREGPMVALSLRGSVASLRALLAREYRRTTGKTPSGSALADALTVLAGEAQECTPEPVHLRVARHGDAVVLDLGDVAGRAIVVDGDGWRVMDRSPVLFRRTVLTAPMLEPARGGNLDGLWELVPVAQADRELLLGWLLHATMSGEPHAILLLGGPQGAGKSTAAEYLGGLVDPSTAPTRAEPREPRQWAISASGSWLIPLDNVSAIPAWLSDALCRAATGDGWVDRALFTNSELAVLRFLRVLLLTSIDTGALRGDLGDRIVVVDLARIPRERRRPKRQLDAQYFAAQPKFLGALLDLLVRVLRELPSVATDGYPRMADFARVLAALDRATGSRALERYVAQEGRVAAEVAEGDPLAGAIVELREWTGTAVELLARLAPPSPAKPPRWLPTEPRALSTRLRRLVETVRVLGIELVAPGPTERPRLWRIRPVEVETPPKSDAPQASQEDSSVVDQRTSWTVETVAPSDADPSPETNSRQSDGCDGPAQKLDAEPHTSSQQDRSTEWTPQDLADAARAEANLFAGDADASWEDPA
jgi:energy-coupling factor transporter ATP-binding protein EcfA2